LQKLASSLHHSVLFLQFTHWAWPSTGMVWSERYTFVPQK